MISPTIVCDHIATLLEGRRAQIDAVLAAAAGQTPMPLKRIHNHVTLNRPVADHPMVMLDHRGIRSSWHGQTMLAMETHFVNIIATVHHPDVARRTAMIRELCAWLTRFFNERNVSGPIGEAGHVAFFNERMPVASDQFGAVAVADKSLVAACQLAFAVDFEVSIAAHSVNRP